MPKELIQLKCQQCGHQWFPRKAEVYQCPNCRSNEWDGDGDYSAELVKLECPKCEYSWIPRTKNVRACPKCKQRLKEVKDARTFHI